jgi:hypothetical protein
MLMALDAGMPRAERMFSACCFTSGSILAYRLADFAAMIRHSFMRTIILVCTDNSNTILKIIVRNLVRLCGL